MVVYFQTKNPNLSKFWSVLQWKKLVNFMDIWPILRPFGIFCGHLVYFVVILVYFSSVGMLCREKSGNPGPRSNEKNGHIIIPNRAIRNNKEAEVWRVERNVNFCYFFLQKVSHWKPFFSSSGNKRFRWKKDLDDCNLLARQAETFGVPKILRIEIFIPGLPDGLFSNQKSQFGYILDGLAMENLGIF
jgi:hypothetical protein